MSIFQQPADLRADAIQAVRQHLLRRLRLVNPNDPDKAIMVEAETIGMSNQQLQGYLALVELGSIHYETASIMMQRTPVQKIPACVAVLTAAHERAVGL